MSALSFVTAVIGTDESNTTTVASASWALTGGQHVFVYVRWEGNSSPTITLSDTAGNTYTAFTATWGNGQVGGQWFYRLNALGNASNVITATFSSAAGYKNLRAITLSGTAPTVTHSVTSGGGGSFTIPGTVTDYAGSMLLMGVSVYNAETSRSYSGPSGTWTEVGTSYNYAHTAYLERPAGDSAASGPTFSGVSSSHVVAMLTLDVGAGAVPSPDSGISKLNGYAVMGGIPNGASLAKMTGYAVLSVPSSVVSSQVVAEVLQAGALPTSARSSQVVAEVLQFNPITNARSSQVVAEVLSLTPHGLTGIINDRDKLLQATFPRYSGASAAALMLTASATTITNGVPSQILFSATRIGINSGAMLFTSANGSPLTISGDSCTLIATNMVGSADTITATVIDGGVTYTAFATVTKVTVSTAGTPLNDANGNPVTTLQNNTLYYYKAEGYNILCSALADPTLPAIKAMGYGDVGVLGYNTNGTVTSHGVRGQATTTANGSTVTSGIVGAQSGFDFYADGTGTNYGPFTGAHDCLVNPQDGLAPGDIVIDAECVARNGWSNTLFRVVRSTMPNQAGALGVLATVPRPLSEAVPAVFTEHQAPESEGGRITTTVDPLYDVLAAQGYLLAGANALGEGQINVTGEGGDIAAGDLIVTSSTPGKGMRAADNVVRNITVARARESVTFDNADDIKTIACIYLAG
jgi:hypothetical protein